MITCPCCNSTINKSISVINNYLLYKCENCTHEFFLPNIENSVIISSELYKNDSDYIGDLENSKDYKYLIQWNHLTAADFLKKYTNINTLLDIGTFNGFFVKFMRDKGYEAYGTDFNNDAINVGLKNYELSGYLSTSIEDFGIKKFDCITAFEIIEHLENPKQFLFDISLLLEKDGILAISCPNNNMLWRVPVDYPPHHLSRFSPNSLKILLNQYGFEILSHFEQMSSIDLLRNYIGSFLRESKKDNSLKGGSHKKYFFINPLRYVLNKARKVTYFVAKPIDKILYYYGYRYVCQLIIAKKNS